MGNTLPTNSQPTNPLSIGKIDIKSFLELKHRNTITRNNTLLFTLLDTGNLYIKQFQNVLNIHNRFAFRLLHDDILSKFDYNLYLQCRAVVQANSFNIFEFINETPGTTYDISDICKVIDRLLLVYLKEQRPIKLETKDLKIIYYFLPKNKTIYKLCFVSCVNRVLNKNGLQRAHVGFIIKILFQGILQ